MDGFRIYQESKKQTNSGVAWLKFTRLRSVGFPVLNLQLLFEFAFEVVLPIAGIILEAANLRFARLMNVGRYAVAGSFWLVAAAFDHSDPFFGVLLIIGLGLIVIAGPTEAIYRTRAFY